MRWAGKIFPTEPQELREVVASLLSESDDPKLRRQLDLPPPELLRAILVPHAVFGYAGRVAGSSYRLVDSRFRKVVMLASQHRKSYFPYKFSVPEFDTYESVFGSIRVSPRAKRLLASPLFSSVEQVHQEHMHEAQLPFLSSRLGEYSILPIVAAPTLTRSEALEIVPYLERELTDDALLVGSVVLFASQKKVSEEQEKRCIDALRAFDVDEISYCDLCSDTTVAVLSQLARNRGWRMKFLSYDSLPRQFSWANRPYAYVSMAFYASNEN